MKKLALVLLLALLAMALYGSAHAEGWFLPPPPEARMMNPIPCPPRISANFAGDLAASPTPSPSPTYSNTAKIAFNTMAALRAKLAAKASPSALCAQFREALAKEGIRSALVTLEVTGGGTWCVVDVIEEPGKENPKAPYAGRFCYDPLLGVRYFHGAVLLMEAPGKAKKALAVTELEKDPICIARKLIPYYGPAFWGNVVFLRGQEGKEVYMFARGAAEKK